MRDQYAADKNELAARDTDVSFQNVASFADEASTRTADHAQQPLDTVISDMGELILEGVALESGASTGTVDVVAQQGGAPEPGPAPAPDSPVPTVTPVTPPGPDPQPVGPGPSDGPGPDEPEPDESGPSVASKPAPSSWQRAASKATLAYDPST